MAISDIFSTSFLFSIAIIIILIGGIFAYVSYRMGEQDHKLNSMIGLISTMAEESRFFRSKIAMLQQKLLPDVDKIQYASQIMGGDPDLINVSDDELEDESESSSVDDNESIQLDDELEYDDDELEDDDDELEDDELEDDDKIKLLNLSLANDDNHNEITNSLEIEQLSFDISNEEIKSVHLDNQIVLEEANVTQQNNEATISEEDMSFLKHVSITDLVEEDVNKPDYKKMSLNKLREVVVSKGLVSEASKLKKNDMLKLLDDE